MPGPSSGGAFSVLQRSEIDVADFQRTAFGLEGDGAGGAVEMDLVHEDAVDVGLDEIAVADNLGGVPFAGGILGALLGAAQEDAFLELLEGGTASCNHVTGMAVHEVDLGAAGPDAVDGLGVQEDAGVGGLPGPAPLEVELIVCEGLFGHHIAKGLAGDVDEALLRTEHQAGKRRAV